jgi:hypothetical protein
LLLYSTISVSICIACFSYWHRSLQYSDPVQAESRMTLYSSQVYDRRDGTLSEAKYYLPQFKLFFYLNVCHWQKN